MYFERTNRIIYFILSDGNKSKMLLESNPLIIVMCSTLDTSTEIIWDHMGLVQ